MTYNTVIKFDMYLDSITAHHNLSAITGNLQRLKDGTGMVLSKKQI